MVLASGQGCVSAAAAASRFSRGRSRRTGTCAGWERAVCFSAHTSVQGERKLRRGPSAVRKTHGSEGECIAGNATDVTPRMFELSGS